MNIDSEREETQPEKMVNLMDATLPYKDLPETTEETREHCYLSRLYWEAENCCGNEVPIKRAIKTLKEAYKNCDMEDYRSPKDIKITRPVSELLHE